MDYYSNFAWPSSHYSSPSAPSAPHVRIPGVVLGHVVSFVIAHRVVISLLFVVGGGGVGPFASTPLPPLFF